MSYPDQHTAATKPRMGDLCIFIGTVCISVKPTLSIRAEKQDTFEESMDVISSSRKKK